MLRLMKHLFWAAAFLFVSVAAFAQKVEFEANAPAVVAVGEAFRIEFSLNAKPEEFVPPTFDGFDVVAGPTLSEGTSVSIVNGNVTKTSSFTYTYVIQASSVGKASISAASVRVDGKSYGTQPLTKLRSGRAPAEAKSRRGRRGRRSWGPTICWCGLRSTATTYSKDSRSGPHSKFIRGCSWEDWIMLSIRHSTVSGCRISMCRDTAGSGRR